MTLVPHRQLLGAAVASAIRDCVTASLPPVEHRLGRPLAVLVLPGAGPNATAYGEVLLRHGNALGIRVILQRAVASTHGDYVADLKSLGADSSIDGLLQLAPIPFEIADHELSVIFPTAKDVDGRSVDQRGLLLTRPDSAVVASTAAAGIRLLAHYDVTLAGAQVVVVGNSPVVGLPFGVLAMHEGAAVTFCHRESGELGPHLRRADIVACAAGVPGLISETSLREGAVVLDFGATYQDGVPIGDFQETDRRVAAYTPVPGGTGPVTTAMLFHNLVRVAAESHGTRDRVCSCGAG